MEPILNVLISNAYAETAPMTSPTPAGGGGLSFMMMFLVLFLFLYFMVWRPQNKRAKEQQNLLNSLSKGDEVMTAGGLLGRIAKLSDNYIALSVANNVEIYVQKTSVVGVLPKGTLKSME